MAHRAFHVIVALAFERFQEISNPRGERSSPIGPEGAPLSKWVSMAGIGLASPGEMDEFVSLSYPGKLDTHPTAPTTIATRAMQRMSRERYAERLANGWWRPTPRRG